MTACRRRAHAACLEYVRLRGQLWTLPAAHPARPALVTAVAHANQQWRALAAAARVAGQGNREGARPGARPRPPSPQ